MRIASLFAGLGGFDLAAEWMGWRTTVLVEKDKQRLEWLKQLYPNAFYHDDIETFDATPFRGAIDIICGGDPCQPNSVAGLRNGINDPRFLWPHMLRTIKESETLYVVNENVFGSISNGVLDQKISDLEAIGYACWPPLLIPAGAVGALHRRDRVWLVAYSLRSGRGKLDPSAIPIGQTKGDVWHNSQRPFKYRPVARYSHSSEILRDADGLSSGLSARFRNKAIESYGNSIVPQVAYEIFKAIESTL